MNAPAPATGTVSITRKYAIYMLALLTAINVVNYIDRLVINSMYDDLRLKFHFSNGEIGAISSVFFITHAITTVPFGWAADRYDRRKVIGFAVLAWSLATLGSAWALGFMSLLMFRGMVGVGEAAYGPVANTVLAESFPQAQKARVIAIFNGGMFAGACAGMYMGAQLGFPDSFYWVAAPGLVFGVLALTLKIKPHRDMTIATQKYPGTWRMLMDAWGSLNVPTLRWMLWAGILISFAAGGYIAWFVDFVANFKHVDKAQAVNIYGGIVVTGGTLGVIIGGRVADMLQRRSTAGRINTIALGFFASTPFAFGAIYLPDGWPFYICSWLMMFFLPWYNGPMAAVIDDVVADKDASTAQASFSFFLHLLGTGPGGFGVGLLSEYTNLQHALLLPVAATVAAGFLCLKAARHVGNDMAARTARAVALAPAASLPGAKVL
jgi:MFS transporter, Spinster family, sphingosine-1-phosphate transporter